MEIIIKKFDELNIYELHEIYKARIKVFVVEQNCPYQEIDDYDPLSYHVYLKNEESILAYARVLPTNTKYKEVSIGRVISLKRREGYGTIVLKECIKVAKEKFDAKEIKIGAQLYAKSFYEGVGFKQCENESYLEDGIPHIHMKLVIK